MIFIESKENSLYKETKKLKERKARDKKGKYIIEGFRLIEEAFRANLNIEYIFVNDEENKRIQEYLGKYLNENIKVYGLKDNLIKELCSTEKPQGVVAVVKMNAVNLNLQGNFYLLCDKLQDPGNLGTIIRSAVAFNVDTIILSKDTVDLYNPKVVRSTQGMNFHINIIRRDLEHEINTLKEKGYTVYSTDVINGKNIKNVKVNGKYAIIMGNEGNGVRENIKNLSDEKLYIKMSNDCESLNVGVATSIILYEFS